VTPSKVGRPIETGTGNKTVPTSFAIDSSLLQPFDDICYREHKSRSEIVNEFVGQFIKAHSEGNDSFKIHQWVNNPQMLAVPNTMSRKEDWVKYVGEEDSKELQKLGNQIDFIRSEINQKLGLENSIKEQQELRLARQARSERLRRSSDIRNKDPTKMKLWEYERWKAIMKSQEDNEQALLARLEKADIENKK
jgi:hypothetical protein